MKATNNITNSILKSLIIFISVFFIQISTVSARGYNLLPSASFSINNLITVLSPLTPKEADFEDALSADIENLINSVLIPGIPAEADFEESPETVSNFAGLAPLTPSEATFNDTCSANYSITALAPVTPSEADFND